MPRKRKRPLTEDDVTRMEHGTVAHLKMIGSKEEVVEVIKQPTAKSDPKGKKDEETLDTLGGENVNF